jgi:hypothetical protein
MNGFIGAAIRAMFDEGVAHRAVVESIGKAVWRRPTALLEIRDVEAERGSRAVYRWEASFTSMDELMRFDEAVRAACQHVARGEE